VIVRGKKAKDGGAERRWPAYAALLAAPLLVYFIVRNAAAGLASPGAIAVASALPPPNYALTLRGLARSAQDPAYKVSRQTLRTAERGAVSMPLAFEPFFIAARAAEQEGRLDRAILLLEEARRRRPNYAATRLQLLAYYGQARRFPELLRELDVSLRLNAEARRLLLPELARLVGDPEGRAALAPALASEPVWREEFYKAARGRRIAPDAALALLSDIRARKKGGDVGLERAFYLETLVAAGAHGRARAIWTESLPPAERAKDGLVFDGGFRGSSAPPPFNWQLNDSDVGRAEIAGAGDGPSRLEAYYFGGRNAVLAEQALALAPGRYTLEFSARSEDGIKSGALSWRLACTPSGAAIATVALGPLGSGYRPHAGSFAVPVTGCAGQKLYLLAEPGDVSAAVTVEIAALKVVRR
jgi:hypothetical protein